MQAGVDGLLRDKTRPAPQAAARPPVVARVIALTAGQPPGEATHWTGRGHGQGRAARCQLGAAHLGGARPAAPPRAHLQAVQRSGVRREGARTSSASMSIRPPTPWCCRSTRRARSRPSTAPSRACR